jgi:ethanolamine ammonia-lyase small subunit
MAEPMKDTRPIANPWSALRALTSARIGLARTGASLATTPLLALRLAETRARDAVHEVLDTTRLAADLAQLAGPVLTVASAAIDRRAYLMRPDLGRRLAPDAAAVLAPHAGAYDLALIVADGLSARAVQTHATPVLAGLLPALRAQGWRIAPVVIVRHGRVAVGDAVASALGAAGAAILIGERPGLSAPDSMGAYLTWRPGPHTTDADRNCVSNIRPDGIGYAEAGDTIARLLGAIRARSVSGIRLKDEGEQGLITEPAGE